MADPTTDPILEKPSRGPAIIAAVTAAALITVAALTSLSGKPAPLPPVYDAGTPKEWRPERPYSCPSGTYVSTPEECNP